MRAPICSLSARCCTRWRRDVCRFAEKARPMIFKAILNRAPTPAVRLNPEVPAELERIINKALEKDRNLRYQHAADMRTDLQRLKRDTESSEVVGGARSGASGSIRSTARSATLDYCEQP